VKDTLAKVFVPLIYMIVPSIYTTSAMFLLFNHL